MIWHTVECELINNCRLGRVREWQSTCEPVSPVMITRLSTGTPVLAEKLAVITVSWPATGFVCSILAKVNSGTLTKNGLEA